MEQRSKKRFIDEEDLLDRDLKEVVDEISSRPPGTVRLGWVKTHMGIIGMDSVVTSSLMGI